MRILLALFALTTFAWSADSASADAEALRLEREELLRTETDAWVKAQSHDIQDGDWVSASSDGGLFGWLSFRGGLWYPALDGDMAAVGESVDLDGELALDDNELTPMPQVTITLGPIGLRFDFFLLEYEGDSNINRQFEFGGVEFEVNEDVASRLEINNFRLLGVFTFIKTDSFRFASLAGLSYYQLRGRIVGATTGIAEEEGDFPVPVVGALIQVRISRFTIEVEASGLAIEYGDIDGTVLDFTASLGITVFKIVALRGGYRLVSVDATVEDFDVDAKLDGFFFGASIQF